MKLDDLKDKEIEITEEGILKVVEKKSKFVPKKGEKCWLINSRGFIDYLKYGNNDKIDRWIANHTPVFATQKEAEEYKHYLEVLDKYKYEFSVEEWENCCIPKYYMWMDYKERSLKFDIAYSVKFANYIYFKSLEDAEAFIKDVGNENVKRFMFDVWE